MLKTLVEKCNDRFRNTRCEKCSYQTYCPHNCETCLGYVHYPDKAPAPRSYDCKRMADFYVCKYSHKYVSELMYAFSMLRDLKDKKHLNILSVGCGPCTDLLALDILKSQGDYKFDTLYYKGVEINPGIWNDVHSDIQESVPNGWLFEIIPKDICLYIEELLQGEWHPDLIVLQYVFSDMHKHTQAAAITTMIKSLAKYIDSCNKNTYVVCNDINLSTDYGGGREYFDRLNNGVSCSSTSHKLHFINSNKPRHFEYGCEYTSNSLKVVPGIELANYQPYTSCASAQMIIKKEE